MVNKGILYFLSKNHRGKHRALCSIMFTPLNPNPKPNQASSRCRITGQSSGWRPRQFRTAASDRCSVALDSGVALAGNRMVFVWRAVRIVGVWSVDSRYEQLLSLMAGCVHTCNGVSWSCCLVCRGNLIFGPKRGAMTMMTGWNNHVLSNQDSLGLWD